MFEETLVVVLSDPDQRRLEALRETLDDWLGNDARLRHKDNAGLVLGDTVSKAYKYYLHAGK
ncbi:MULTISPECIES: hypothetical protein [Nocardiopsis]|uniref:Uncharacterized protein n=1 Tax=Nocardiopsis sinuspersici TaxID=501010 RepID=A0A7Z0BJ53_9ACTN|nr:MULTISPECIES: hypothetical protein [Nocardiopsis]NYH51034.1 hypothetical protein [Nocardiopsis sinuspersici]